MGEGGRGEGRGRGQDGPGRQSWGESPRGLRHFLASGPWAGHMWSLLRLGVPISEMDRLL